MTTVGDLKTIDGFEKFLKINGPGKVVDSPYIETFKTIYKNMNDSATVSKGLRALEDAMWGELERRIPSKFWQWCSLTSVTKEDMSKGYKKIFRRK